MAGLSFIVETSTNLIGWQTDAGASETIMATEDHVETVRVIISPSLLIEPRLFVRIRAVPTHS
jgi:hypothetical protein